MKFSMTGQEKDDLSIQVTTWSGLTVYYFFMNANISHYFLLFSNIVM